jgi:predicted metal-dependent peptidase
MPSRSRVFEGEAVTVRRALSPGAGQSQSRDPLESGDVFDDKAERELFPDDAGEQGERVKSLRELAVRSLALAHAMGAMKGQGGDASASQQHMVGALRGLYRTPWELALQKWMESVSPGERTFSRPPRRGADRSDVVLPGRKRETWMLNVVLDTSGSMTEEIPRALGAIADFCDSVSIDEIRVVQCDTAVTSDEVVSPGQLSGYRIGGFGGSDLTPALLTLAIDPLVTACVVITDGDIAYPPAEMPYAVLWVLPGMGNPGFRPPYGHVVTMQQGGLS